MKRSFDPAVLEIMDRPQPASHELERDLQHLRQLNRWFGSYRLVLKLMRRWIKPGARLRLVDLATGSGDIPRLLVDFARSLEAHIEVDAVDRQSATLQIARKLSARYPEIFFHEADILEWGGAESYDIALCSLVLHHFSDDDAAKILQRCRALSKRFVLVSDLRRGFLLRAGGHVLTALIFREPMTRFAAALFAHPPFSFSEIAPLPNLFGAENFCHV